MRYLLAFFLAIVTPTKIAALDFHEQIEAEFYATLGALQRQAFAGGEGQIASLLSHPTVSIDWGSKLPGATAQHGNGRNVVTITAEMIKLMYFFAELSILTNNAPTSELNQLLKCKTEYQEQVRNQLFHVFGGRVLSGEFSTYDSPEEFAEFGNHCSGIERFFPLAEELKPQRDMLVRNSIGFIIMHEVGHIVIGHTISSRPDEVRQSILCASRRQEKEADEFAVVRLVRYGFPEAVTSNAYWDLSLSVASIMPGWENTSTHPSPSRRMSESISLAIEEARRLGATPDPRLIDLAQQLLRVQERIEVELSEDGVRVQPVRC